MTSKLSSFPVKAAATIGVVDKNNLVNRLGLIDGMILSKKSRKTQRIKVDIIIRQIKAVFSLAEL